MSTTRKIPKTLIALFFVVFVVLLFWIALRTQLNESESSSLSIADSDTEFVVDIPQKAMFRNYFTVSVEATPGTLCELIYIPPSGENQQMDATATTEGLCKWRWKIEESHGKGAGRLIFTIDGKSETHFFEILSSF